MEKMEAAKQQYIRHDIPKGAIILRKADALLHQLDVIKNWRPRSDVWLLIYGRPILSAAAALSSIYINQRFRRKLKFRDGLFPTVAGLVSGATLMTSLFYMELVQSKLLLLEVPCPLCLESRSILLQTFTGLLFPLIVVPVANFSIAVRSGIYNIPHPTDVKGVFRIVSSVYKPMIPIFASIFTLHVLLAGFITHSQIKSFLRVLDVQNFLQEEEEDRKRTSNVL